MIKKFCKLFLLTVALFIGVTVANAEEVKETLVISNYTIDNEPVVFPDNALNSTVRFHVKKTAEGKYVYCMHYAKKPPVSSITYSKGELITDNGIIFIISNGLNATSDAEFFKYQTALWIYLVETNQMKGTHNDIDRFINTIANNTDDLSKEIRAIVEYAKTFGSSLTTNPTISIDASNVTFTQKDGYYISSNITVNSSEGDYSVSLTSAPSSTQIDQKDGYFTIKVPVSSVTKTTKISFAVNTSKEVYTSYYYTPSNSNYQKMAATYKNEVQANASGSVTITVKEPVITKIIKVDADTGKALEGAILELTNSAGTIIDTWETTATAKEFKNLAADTYTLTEVSAPKGYVKSDEKVVFKVDANGNLTDTNGNKLEKVTFTNKKEVKITGVKISKQDITNKQELPGATLVVKDYDGNVIKTWVSTSEPTFIELEPGIYTLSETIAPEGYILSTETVTFTVKEDGTIDTVVMYNTPDGKEIVVENTASFKTMASTIIGLIASVFGAGLIFKKPKKLV